MYVPAAFEVSDLLAQHALIQSHPLATVITNGVHGLEANHIPLHLDSHASPLGVLKGHVARANPLWRDDAAHTQVLAVFQGPHAYITPGWYDTKAESGDVVPTWNYVTVHARGTLRVVDDPQWLRGQLGALTAQQEQHLPHPWAVDEASDEFIQTMIKAIVGIEICITDIQGKWKVSQNRPMRDQQSVERHLIHSGLVDMADLVRSKGPVPHGQ